jgi:hypothetical protein
MSLCVALGAAAAVVVAGRVAEREPPVPPGWAEVVVLGRDDAPIEGVTLRWDGQQPGATTDARGVARIEIAGHGDHPSVELGGTLSMGERDESTDHGRQWVRAPRTVLRLRNAIPFDVTFIDGRDGRPLAGGSVAWPTWPDERPFPALVGADATEHRLVSFGCENSLIIDAPTGFVVPDEELPVRPIVGAFVRRQTMTIPAWPAGRVRVRALEHDGRPAVGELSASIKFGWNEAAETRVVADADGRFELRTLPLVPHAVARIEVQRNREHTARANVEIVDGKSEYDVILKLPIGRDGGRCGGCGIGRFETKELRLNGDANVRLRVLRSDGTPARRVHVLLRAGDVREEPFCQTSVVTDDAGRASVSGVDSRRAYAAILVEPGCGYALVDVPLVPGGTTDCELREPSGESIDLAVVDVRGRPVPFARVSAETRDEREWTWFRVVDCVQDVAPRTDVDGRIVLRGLPPGEIDLKAISCGRETRATFVAGQSATLRFR